jgi:hypothetical protein
MVGGKDFNARRDCRLKTASATTTSNNSNNKQQQQKFTNTEL